MRYQPKSLSQTALRPCSEKWRPDAINRQSLITKAGRYFVRPQQRREQMTLRITKTCAVRKHFRRITGKFRTTKIHAVLNFVSTHSKHFRAIATESLSPSARSSANLANIAMIPIYDFRRSEIIDLVCQIRHNALISFCHQRRFHFEFDSAVGNHDQR